MTRRLQCSHVKPGGAQCGRSAGEGGACRVHAAGYVAPARTPRAKPLRDLGVTAPPSSIEEAARAMGVARDYAECEREPWRDAAVRESVVRAAGALVAHDDVPAVVAPCREAASALPEPLYDAGGITLYCGDSDRLIEALLARHGRPHHVFTDPPYSDRVVTGARTSRGTKDVSAGWIGAEAPRAFVPFATEAPVIRGLLSRANASRWTVLTCDHVHAALLEIEPPSGLRHVRLGAWVKPDGAPQMNGMCPANGFESIAILHSSEAMRWNSGGKRGVWTHYVERDVPWHPTPKPVALARELLRDFTDPDDLIFDLYAGSGAFGVAARFEGRRAVLVEINPTFARLTAQRLSEGRGRMVDVSLPVEDRRGTLPLFARTA